MQFRPFLCCLTLLLVAQGCADAPPRLPADVLVSSEAKIRAVTLDARRRPADSTLVAIKRLGATHLTLVAFGFQPHPDVPVIEMHAEGGWYSETDAGIRALTRRADSLEMGLILKPHVWVGHYDAEEQGRAAISFETGDGWRRWEVAYRRFLLHYARLAETVGADVLVVGTELAGTLRREAFWRTLIAEVRAVYDGELTYAANWYDGFEAVPFWDALDYVGVQAYFPLTDASNPTLAALKEGWQPHLKALRRIVQQTSRPVLFTEIGYRSAEDAARAPWRWPTKDEPASPAPALQARCYRAFFTSVWPRPWLAGAILWKWHAAGAEGRTHGFTPQGKPVIDVIRHGFSGVL